MKITKKSPLTGIEHTLDIPVTQEQLDAWKARKGLIQNIMPDLTPGQREFLMTGIPDEEWDRVFGDEPREKDHD